MPYGTDKLPNIQILLLSLCAYYSAIESYYLSLYRWNWRQVCGRKKWLVRSKLIITINHRMKTKKIMPDEKIKFVGNFDKKEKDTRRMWPEEPRFRNKKGPFFLFYVTIHITLYQTEKISVLHKHVCINSLSEGWHRQYYVTHYFKITELHNNLLMLTQLVHCFCRKCKNRGNHTSIQNNQIS